MDYEHWLQTARNRLALLYQQKAAIEEEISKLERGIEGFAPLVEKPGGWSGPDAGLTDSIRLIFRQNWQKTLAPTEIRDELLNRGMRLGQNNPLAAIHEIIARLVKRGLVKPIQAAGKIVYRWADQTPQVISPEEYPPPRTAGKK